MCTIKSSKYFFNIFNQCWCNSQTICQSGIDCPFFTFSHPNFHINKNWHFQGPHFHIKIECHFLGPDLNKVALAFPGLIFGYKEILAFPEPLFLYKKPPALCCSWSSHCTIMLYYMLSGENHRETMRPELKYQKLKSMRTLHYILMREV